MHRERMCLRCNNTQSLVKIFSLIEIFDFRIFEFSYFRIFENISFCENILASHREDFHHPMNSVLGVYVLSYSKIFPYLYIILAMTCFITCYNNDTWWENNLQISNAAAFLQVALSECARIDRKKSAESKQTAQKILMNVFFGTSKHRATLLAICNGFQ